MIDRGRTSVQAAGGRGVDEITGVETAAGIEVPASAMATCAELVALLRPFRADLPMEAEPGDFLVALDEEAGS